MLPFGLNDGSGVPSPHLDGRRTHGVSAPLALALAVLALTATPALAARTELSPIIEANGSHLVEPNGLAVDGFDDLWVSDIGVGAVDKFNSSGAFAAASSGAPWSGVLEGVAFSNASKHLYVSEFIASDVWGLEPSGAYANIDLKGPWSSGFVSVRIAADNSSGPTSGDLYVAGEGNAVHRIDGAGAEAPFSDSGEPGMSYIEGAKLTGFGPGASESFSADPSGLAVDSAGDLYVADGEAVYEFEPSGKFLRSFAEVEGNPIGGVGAVAVDPTNGHVLIAAGGVIDEFASTGGYLDNVEEVSPRALAVDSTGRLYVAETNVVDVFGDYTPPTHLPKILTGATSSLALTSANLNATVKPKGGGEVSECRFEYGTNESYGATAPCVPATFSSTTAVTAELTGLQPDTVYSYRLHIVDPVTGPGGAVGPVETFRTFTPNPVLAGPPASDCPNPAHTGLSDRLPDCRAYELLTPVNKGDAEDIFGDASEGSVNGGDTFEDGYPDENPSAEGDKFFFTTAAAFGPFPAAGENGYVFSRDSSGWQETSLASPTAGAQSIGGNPILSPDFSQTAIEDTVGSLGNPAAIRNTGLVGPPSGPYTTLFDAPSESSNSEFVGASSDFGRVFFQSTEHGFAAPAKEQLPGSNALYEYAAGRYSLLNVNSEGKPLSACGAVSPAGKVAVGHYAHAVSSDGSRVFFLSPDPADLSCYEESPSSFTGTAPQLYVRSGGHTTEVSAPAGFSDPSGPQPVAFAGASADGSHVFFVTRGELTADDVGNHDPELYEYDVETEKLTRISSGSSHSTVGNVGWVVPSEDGSTVYFTATGRLAPGAPALSHGGGEAGEYNLYRYDTETAATTYIATVSGSDYNESEASGVLALNIRNPINTRSDWETTPDGRYLLFAAVENLTGYDSHDPTGHCGGSLSGTGGGNGNCGEVYRYDAADGSLICVSCNPSGAAPSANALFDDNTHYHEVRAISDDGAYVFFDTLESLVPADTNGRLDVYEWHDGEISLISSGQDASNSFFLGIDASGADVFLGTHARLVPQDVDSSGDLYDARIDGGFPVSQGSAACEGDACQSPPAAPNDATPASLTFSGAGDLVNELPPPKKTVTKKAIAKCKKGFIKKKNKCVKKKKSKRAKKAKKSAHTNGRASR
jgi:hypothetical protein